MEGWMDGWMDGGVDGLIWRTCLAFQSTPPSGGKQELNTCLLLSGTKLFHC